MSNFNELAKVLAHEQSKGFANKSAVGGIETYVENWAKRTRTSENAAVVEQILDALKGYAQADSAQRKDMIQRAVNAARTRDVKPARPAPPLRPKAASQPANHAAQPPSAPPHRASATQKKAPLPAPIELRDDAALLPPPEPIPDDGEGDAPVSRGALPPRLDFGLDAPITRLHGIGKAKEHQLARLGIATVHDLLYHFPRAYRPVKKISELMYGDEATIVAQVSHINEYKTRNGFHIIDLVLIDATGGITAKFFNQPWIARNLRARQYVVASGKVDRDLNKLSFKSPEIEPLTKELQRLLDSARVYPVYPLTEGVKANWLRKTVRDVVNYWADKVVEPLPASVRHDARLMPLPNALREIHFPTSMQSMAWARHRFAFEELLYIQLGVLQQRRRWLQDPVKPLSIPPNFLEQFENGLPYALTGAQRRTIGEIFKDIQTTAPMSRLLQGDVGAGKTVVAMAALLVANLNQSQAVLMAPTEILAEQHFNTVQKILPTLAEKIGVQPRVGLLVGSMKLRDKQQAHQDIAEGKIDIAIGTHALIQEAVNFPNVTLAVIDEQHRFGVNQRAALRQKGYNPHILVMSATPIPRTLALTVYGDLDLSILDELPPGRTAIMTKWLEPKERERAYSFLRKQINEGRQAFVICPLIEESETIDAKAAVEEYETLRTQIFPDLRVGLVHGKLRPAEKDAVMNEFREHQIDILVATSVVEVGIDVPNATVMLIEGADRFGLAQLHQFRGRVGRGAHQAYCMLLAEQSGSTSDERLKVIEATQDGFKLAEADLLMRGPGEFFGTKQSGLPDLRVAQLTDVKLLEQARKMAQDIFARDPELQEQENQLLKKGMRDFWKGEGDLS
ncbi:MAG: ATP-dependent DNA helicase RecG [Chloroflexi bacterium]|nr:ATP-dependent DNA helicase RecG [Chloroflexota bacterium]